MARKKIKTAKEELGVPDKITFTCHICHTHLVNPVEETSAYVLRDGEPILICLDCVENDDLFLWGSEEILDDKDKKPKYIPEMIDDDTTKQVDETIIGD